AGRLSLETKVDPQFGPAIRVRHSSHRSERENLESAKHSGSRDHRWQSVVRQPGTERFCAANWSGVGSIQERKDFRARRVWGFLRPASAQVLPVCGESQSIVHEAYLQGKSRISE